MDLLENVSFNIHEFAGYEWRYFPATDKVYWICLILPSYLSIQTKHFRLHQQPNCFELSNLINKRKLAIAELQLTSILEILVGALSSRTVATIEASNVSIQYPNQTNSFLENSAECFCDYKFQLNSYTQTREFGVLMSTQKPVLSSDSSLFF